MYGSHVRDTESACNSRAIRDWRIGNETGTRLVGHLLARVMLLDRA